MGGCSRQQVLMVFETVASSERNAFLLNTAVGWSQLRFHRLGKYLRAEAESRMVMLYYGDVSQRRDIANPQGMVALVNLLCFLLTGNARLGKS